jgi:F0F1-type ATP synthase membrane subunit b/b'
VQTFTDRLLEHMQTMPAFSIDSIRALISSYRDNISASLKDATQRLAEVEETLGELNVYQTRIKTQAGSIFSLSP